MRSLQDYYRRRAETSLQTYRNIVFLAAKEEFHRIEADALVTILRGVIEAAAFYGNRKSAIPSDSFWFERIYKHANWLTVGHVQLDMALRTGRPTPQNKFRIFFGSKSASRESCMRPQAPWQSAMSQRRGLYLTFVPLNLFEPRIAKRFEAGAEEDRAVAQAIKLGCRLAPPSHLRLVKPNRIQRKIYPTKSAHTSMSPMPGVLEKPDASKERPITKIQN